MPVPKRRTGKTRKNQRRSHHAKSKPNLVECENCGEQTVPHRVCPKCGHYGSRLAIKIDED